MAFGPTGKYPLGKLNANDEGELVMGVAADHEHRVVVLQFGTDVRWLGLPPDSARQLAASLIRAAGEVENAH
jgi:hypothetical protein